MSTGTPADPMVGRQFDQFRLISLIGAGGMGMVYRARDTALERDVAIKVLRPGCVEESARLRLIREARTASSLNYPHICHIYGVGETGGDTWIAMELIEGRSIRELLPPGGFPPDVVIRHGRHVAGALAHAHHRGVVHRDLKAANVMITPDGCTKVLDFGLAKRISNDLDDDSVDGLSVTRSGVIVGTPNYLAPEVLRGRPADARSDIWTLGILLYEMATGVPPFRGDSLIEVSAAILDKPVQPLPAHVPPGLAGVIRRCLEKDAGSRFQQASEVYAALDALHTDSGSRFETAPPPTRASRARRAALMAGAFLALVALGAFLARGPLGAIMGRAGGREGDAPVIDALAVLPLANLSGDPGQDFFADGMTEELITSLASIPSLKVISRTSVMQYKATRKTLPEIGRELGVNGVLEGSVTRSGNRVRITAQLIEAKTDRHLWARSYERNMDEVLALQHEVARDIARQIRLTLTPEATARLEGGRKVNPEAYELYLKGRFALARLTDEELRRSIDLFQQAAAVDPLDPRPYTGITDALLLRSQLLQTMSYAEAMPMVKANAEKALGLDGNSAEAHTSMGLALIFAERDWDRAGRHLDRAVDLNPSYALAHLALSIVHAARGDTAALLAEDRIGRDLDPLSLLMNWNLGNDLAHLGHFEEALAVGRKTLEIDPGSMLPQSLIVKTYEMMGDFESALEGYGRWLPAEERDMVPRLREAWKKDGPRGYWAARLERARQQHSVSKANSCEIAILLAYMGEHEAAFEALYDAADTRGSDVLFLRVIPAFAPLRIDPRFEEIARRAGLPPPA